MIMIKKLMNPSILACNTVESIIEIVSDKTSYSSLNMLVFKRC